MDNGELAVSSPARFIMRGTVVCRSCGYAAPINGGILDLLDLNRVDATTKHEQELRETEWASPQADLTELDLAEIEPHMEALRIRPEHIVLELGCGSGRYTSLLAERCHLVVAVDLSLAGLQAVARRIGGGKVALVRADVARFAVRPGAFSAVLSTLTSNLPSATHRRTLYRIAATALPPHGGSFVSGTHYYGLRARLSRVQKEGPYSQGGIYRFYTTRKDVRQEMAPYFKEMRMQPVQIVPPLGRTLRLPLRRVSRLSERIAGLREFGSLLMTVASKPTRPL